jgi:hypothetical protein
LHESFDLDGARDRFHDMSRGLGDALRDTRTRMTQTASDGADYARALADDALARTRGAARTMRATIEERPLEALLIVGLASFAVGWILRHMQRSDRDAARTSPRRRAPATRRRADRA